jgi:hypothetical protein
MAAAAALAGVALVPGGAAQGAPLFTENPGHAQPAVQVPGSPDQPYGWFGANGAKTWEVYRKFTGNGHPNPSPVPDPNLEPRITNQTNPTNLIKATVHNQTAATPWWNGSGLWFGPGGSSTPSDYILLISDPYTINQQNGQRQIYGGGMDIRVGFMEKQNAWQAVNADNGDGRVGHYSLADFYEGPVGADVVSAYLALGAGTADAGGPINFGNSQGYARAAASTFSEGSAFHIPLTHNNNPTGVAPYPVTSRIFNDPANGNQPTFELKFGTWTGTFVIPSLTIDAGDQLGANQTAFEGGGFDINDLLPVTYLNTAGDTAGTAQMMDTYLTIRGDANLDGRVNGSDFALLASNFGRTDRAWSQGDFNQDGAINGTDFALLAGNFGKTVPGVPAGLVTESDWMALESYGASIGVSVPEPAALPALAAALGLMARRRRRN